MAQIKLDSIAHSYRDNPAGPEDYAIKEVNTVWEDGGAYALLGASGCGKTTMLNLISGLLTPSQGRILYDGRDVTGLPPEKRNIAQVFQFPVLYDTMTVFDNLAFPLKNRGKDRPFITRRVHEIADALDLTPFLHKRASGLAADAKQKISLGRGLVRDDVAAILFDEPLTVIDPHLKWQLRRKLKEIHKQFGLTLIYVTHDQTEAMTFAEKVVLMYDGRLVQIGTPEELFENPAHTFVGYFIGSPGMNFVDCRVEGDRAVVSAGSLTLPAPLAARARGLKGTLQLGIRPLYLDLASAPCDNGIKARVVSMEDEGSSRIVTLEAGADMLKSRRVEGAHVPPVGADCWICFPPDKTKLFCDDKLIDVEVGS
ncbi:ABC transporter ATP-binding protein [Desulfoplanes formicivorans]|uniref:ABC transporter ATP-binding protein n=1 Tax=Desulfoplanes formicivorans TaxID=1592317 RepID=A0A194AC86_9BACT|nr:ABC transporter ATP-binding protein [Desulfoplanes formicivorans]GAU07757.1 ABC transporter ATP-binding protein [Desulfoplanes formicivorans]